jgi:hypothetical protein
VRILSYSTSRGVPANARNAFSCASISVSTRSSPTNSTYAARLQPKVATNTESRLLPRRITAQSTCICSPGAVSKRMIGAASAFGSREATNAFSIV